MREKTEGSESLPYGRKIHWTVKVSSGEPVNEGERKSFNISKIESIYL